MPRQFYLDWFARAAEEASISACCVHTCKPKADYGDYPAHQGLGHCAKNGMTSLPDGPGATHHGKRGLDATPSSA